MGEVIGLFDANLYGEGRKPRAEKVKVEVTLEPVEGDWALMATRRGIDEYQHEVQAELTHGSVVTRCGLRGRIFTCLPGNEHLMVATKCPACVKAGQ